MEVCTAVLLSTSQNDQGALWGQLYVEVRYVKPFLITLLRMLWFRQCQSTKNKTHENISWRYKEVDDDSHSLFLSCKCCSCFPCSGAEGPLSFVVLTGRWDALDYHSHTTSILPTTTTTSNHPHTVFSSSPQGMTVQYTLALMGGFFE